MSGHLTTMWKDDLLLVTSGSTTGTDAVPLTSIGISSPLGAVEAGAVNANLYVVVAFPGSRPKVQVITSVSVPLVGADPESN